MKPILRRGLTLRLKNGMCVVLLEEKKYGWDCLSLDHVGLYASTDILVFYEDLKEGEVILNMLSTVRKGTNMNDIENRR